jgi:hypothetical protein
VSTGSPGKADWEGRRRENGLRLRTIRTRVPHDDGSIDIHVFHAQKAYSSYEPEGFAMSDM